MQNLSQAQAKLGITAGGGGINELTGDVTAGPGSGAQAATIPADTITYAKMQNVSAASRLLGRGSAAGAGDVEEITLGTGLSMSATTLNAAVTGADTDSSWLFNASTVEANPGVAQFGMDSATPSLVTRVWFNDLTVAGFNIDTLAGFISPGIAGIRIYIQQKNDPTKAILVRTTGGGGDQTGWWRLTVTVIASASIFDAGAECAFTFLLIPRDRAIFQLTGDVTAGPTSGVTAEAATIAANAVTDTKLRDSGALSVIGRSANSAGDPADISAAAASGAVLRESGSVLGFGTVAAAGLATDSVTAIKIAADAVTTTKIINDAVTDAKLRDSVALSVIGRSANSAGDPADISAVAASGAVMRESGAGVLGFGTVATAGIADNAVNDAKLRDSLGFSVIGKPTTGVGDPSDIQGVADTVLGRVGTANVAFAQVATGQIANAAVTNLKLRDSGPLSVIGRSANSAGDPADISVTAATGFVLRESGSLLSFGEVATSGIANDAVSNAKLSDMPSNTIKGNNTGGVANPLDLTVAQVTAMLDVFTSLLKGLVPASGGGTTTFLRADGTFSSLTATAKSTDVDFGDVFGVNSQTFTIADADVTATSRINCWLSGTAPTGKDNDDMLAEDPLKFVVVPGAGTFDLYIEQPIGALNGAYRIEYMIASAV